MSDPRRSPDRLPATLVALPPLVLLAIGALVLVAGAAGLDSQWREMSVNLPATIALHDWAQAIRRIEAGEDPNRPDVVPGGNSSDPARRMTPLEASVREGELDLVKVMLEHGATADGAERLRLSCLAVSRESEEVAELLLGAVPASAQCAGVDPDAGVVRQ